ncbi:right-handed parallel beta-helix repeat-containing protein [Pseudactinotalea suaedae]|uniref:right-handed parallel beta-helix repeat-containing protein n=1 Tax=Pseudactinotalea suaedae TaxID=1524924 RepID=UPI0012E18B61|nr:right-handed parallel beta-helix repeat-containing protein [Pseudactinotalea suaedae]
MTTLTVHVAPGGRADGAGTAEDPVATPVQARDLLRRSRRGDEHATVLVAPGTYALTEPLLLEAVDSHTSWVATSPGSAVLDGGRRLTGWSPVGPDGDVWVADLPEGDPRSLYVDGRCRPRAAWPREGEVTMTHAESVLAHPDLIELFAGGSTFGYDRDQIGALTRPEIVEVLVPHYWVQERMPVASQDVDAATLTCSRRSLLALRDDVGSDHARFRLENVMDALGEVPGEWVLDHVHRQVLYAPAAGEHAEDLDVVVPVTVRLVEVRGTAAAPVTDVHWSGFELAHAAATQVDGVWKLPQQDMLDGVEFATSPQAEVGVSGAIELSYAVDVSMSDCTVRRVDGHAVCAREGVQGLHLEHCLLTELGAGGVHLDGAAASAAAASDPSATSGNRISDCEIGPGGRVYPGAVGVLIRDSHDNAVVHNHIHDMTYSGVSVGWVWGYEPSAAYGNLIEANRIHHLGGPLLSDMGGIYLLGVAPGTVVRRNLVHDVACANYGGWGIYLDEGSSHVVVSENVVHSTATQAFHQHYGRENIVRGNVLAFGERGQVKLTRPEPHVSASFHGNLVVGDKPGFVSRDEGWIEELSVLSDLNQIWGTGAQTVVAAFGRPDRVEPDAPFTDATERWRAQGRDRHSTIVDPGLVVHEDGTVSATGDLADGIHVPDLTDVGPRRHNATTAQEGQQ